MITPVTIGGRRIGPGEPVYVVAEMSANHHQSFEEAARIVRAARDSGADAIKLQTYTPDTMTIDCRTEPFQIGKGTIWEGRNLYELYGEAYTPWEWQPELKKLANGLGMDCFSTPFDVSAVEFLEKMDVSVHKIASFEVVDIPLIERIARTGKPVIMSTGMTSLDEIEEAVQTLRNAGCRQMVLLKCTSAYPAPPEAMNLRTIRDMAERFGVPVGLSDHTMGIAASVAAVALGACVIEKHFTLSRAAGGPDAAFSLEPQELKEMVDAIRTTEKAMGRVNYELTPSETAMRVYRRSLFVVEDMEQGSVFSPRNVRSIRPGHGLPPKHIGDVMGRRAARRLKRGTPLDWSMVE